MKYLNCSHPSLSWAVYVLSRDSIETLYLVVIDSVSMISVRNIKINASVVLAICDVSFRKTHNFANFVS